MAVDTPSVRHRLLEEQQRLRGEIEELEERERAEKDPVEGHFGDGDQLVDDAAFATEREKEQAIRFNLGRLLTDVNHALDKLDSGTYGRCDECGTDIPTARLEALPHANLCLSCKSKLERSRR